MGQEITDKSPTTKIKIATFGLLVYLILFWDIAMGSFISVILYVVIAWAIFMYIWAKVKYGDITVLEAIKIDLKAGLEEANKSKIDNISNPDLKQQVEEREIEGWSITDIDNSKNRVTMEGTKGGTIGGHAVTGVLTGLWTFGAGNVAYNQLSKKRNKERIVVSLDENKASSDSEIDPYELLEQLKGLKDSGAITAEEYDDKKEDILDRI